VVVSHERRRRHPYVVTYEDGEGDWLLVGDDVPWEYVSVTTTVVCMTVSMVTATI
jgi:hypothetical protein